jgi:hypothetical protein
MCSHARRNDRPLATEAITSLRRQSPLPVTLASRAKLCARPARCLLDRREHRLARLHQMIHPAVAALRHNQS